MKPFSNKSAFDSWIAKPLRSNAVNSLRTLGDLIKGTCLRRTKMILTDSLKLPRYTQHIHWVELVAEERALYDFFKRRAADLASGSRSFQSIEQESTGSRTVTFINFLRRICDHGEHLLPQSALAAWKDGTSESVDWKMMCESRKMCSYCGGHIDDTSTVTIQLRCRHSVCLACILPKDDDDLNRPACPCCATVAPKDASIKCSAVESPRPSSKLRALLENLQDEQRQNGEPPMHPPKKRFLSKHST